MKVVNFLFQWLLLTAGVGLVVWFIANLIGYPWDFWDVCRVVAVVIFIIELGWQAVKDADKLIPWL